MQSESNSHLKFLAWSEKLILKIMWHASNLEKSKFSWKDKLGGAILPISKLTTKLQWSMQCHSGLRINREINRIELKVQKLTLNVLFNTFFWEEGLDSSMGQDLSFQQTVWLSVCNYCFSICEVMKMTSIACHIQKLNEAVIECESYN